MAASPQAWAGTNRAIVVPSLMLAMFLSAMEGSIVATAMPSIVSKLGGFAEFAWVFSVFLLAQAATIPLYGKLADLFGRRLVFVAGTGLFLVGSLLCGLSGSMVQLILFRIVQGVGAGAVQPIASTIVGDIFTLRERARIQGWLSSMWAVASLLGPLLGGFIVERLDWAWVFWVNLPFALLAILGVYFVLHEPLARSRHTIDFTGAGLLMVGVSCLLLALLQGGVAGSWTAPPSLGLFAAAVVLLTLFIRQELRAPEPILPLGLFRNRVVTIGDGGTLLAGGLLLGISTFVPLFVQGSLGAPATVAGFTLTPMSIGWPIAAAVSGRTMIALGYRATSMLGAALVVVGCALLALTLGMRSPVWTGAPLFVVGLGMGFLNNTLLVAVQGAVSWRTRGVATASTMFARQLGSTLWVAALGSLFNATLLRHLAGLPEATRAAVGGDELAIPTVLLDAHARAALDPSVLQQLEEILASGVELVFLGVLVTSVLCLALVSLLPGGTPREAHQDPARLRRSERGA
ncbi:MAG: MFS transporter [Chloroflexi bacterium]|nr:MFS transporter [Chloroflexota bacterium]